MFLPCIALASDETWVLAASKSRAVLVVAHSFTLTLSVSVSVSVQRRVLESEGCVHVPGFHVVFVWSLEKWQLFHQISLEELLRGF